MRDDSEEKPCISYSAREVHPATKPAEARMDKNNGAWTFGPAPTAGTEEWRTRFWPFTPCAEPDVSFGGSVAEETPNLCYMFAMANDEEPVGNALMASSSPVITT